MLMHSEKLVRRLTLVAMMAVVFALGTSALVLSKPYRATTDYAGGLTVCVNGMPCQSNL